MELFKSRTRVAYTNAVGDKVYPVIVDIKKGIKSTEDIQFVSSDVNTGILSVAFISGNENFNVSGADVVCSVMRPDASTLDIPCTIVENNIVEVPLGINGTSQDGIYSFDFKVFKGGNKVVGTPIMNYSVSLSISNDNAVLEDDRLPVLTMLMTQVTELKDEVREAINQANTATEATREATANAIEATTTANETISKVTQDTANAIAEVNATSDTMVENVNNAISNMDITVNDKISEVDTAKNDMINDVSSTKANMVTEVTNAKDEMTATVTNKVNEVEGRFNALTASQQQSSEVIDARDGETSLKARLDRDIEKAKQVYVNIEGSNISTDSSSGYAKDVEILGNTIQDSENLADIRSVGDTVEGQELYEIPVVSCGKNLFNDKLELGALKTTDGESADNGSMKRTASYVKVKPNTKYVIQFSAGESKCNVFTYDKNKKFISYIGYVNSFTTDSNTNFIRFYNSYANDLSINIQLEEGTVATPYEPYIEDKLTILSPVQLERVGDVADRLIEKDGVWGVEKNVGELKLENLNNVTISTTDTTYRVYLGEIIKIKAPCNYGFGTSLCNMLPFIQGEYYTKDEEHYYLEDAGAVFLFINKNKFDGTKEGFNKYLKGKGYVIKYQLAQPQFIPLPHDQQVKLRTFANKTNISFLTEIEGTIKAQVPKSLGATVNTHTEQISNLNKELDRVKKLEESTVSTVETESDFTTVEATSNGYFEDVKLEGKTLVNLNNFKKSSSLSDRVRWENNDVKNIQGGVTVWNLSDKPISIDVHHLDTDTYKAWYNVSSNSCKVISIGDNEKVGAVIGLFVNGWTSSELDKLKKSVIILEGDHAQNPPSYFEGLKSVGDGADEIVVSSVNPYGNLFDGELEVGSLNASGDTDWTSYVKTGLIRVKPSSEVICKIGKYKGENATSTDIRMAEYDMNKNFIKFSGGTYKATVSDKTHYVKFAKKLETSDDSRVDINAVSDVVVVYGNKLHDIPHQSDKKRLLYYNEETQTWEKPILRQWDSIEKHANGKYYYHQRSGEVVLNGSENWGLNAGWSGEEMSTNSYYLTADGQKTAGLMVKSNGATNIISEVMPTVFINNTSFDSDCVSGENHTGAIYIRINKSKVSNGIKPYLQQNPMRVVYQLAQEKVYECTNIDLITYANETNYIVESGAIAPKAILKVHNNISNVVKILQQKVSLLENKFIEGLKQVLAGDMYSLAELLYPEDFEEVETENNIMLLPLE